MALLALDAELLATSQQRSPSWRLLPTLDSVLDFGGFEGGGSYFPFGVLTFEFLHSALADCTPATARFPVWRRFHHGVYESFARRGRPFAFSLLPCFGFTFPSFAGFGSALFRRFMGFFGPFLVFFRVLRSSRRSGFLPRLRGCGTLFRSFLGSLFLELERLALPRQGQSSSPYGWRYRTLPAAQGAETEAAAGEGAPVGGWSCA